MSWIAVQCQAASPLPAIPRPAHLETADGTFHLTKTTHIRADAVFQSEARFLAERLQPATGREWQILSIDAVATSASDEANCDITLQKVPADATLGEEGYRFAVNQESVRIEAAASAGAFYGCQTLRQLLPADLETQQTVEGVDWFIPWVKIEDQPRFSWRGMMLDSARHFQDKATIKRFIDLLAAYKMNRLHWHLCDDQGWRVEIKKYPRLTEVGAWRPNRNAQLNRLPNAQDERYGGFYSQEDLREIVAYAASRHVIIVPEIEMPGHCLAMIAAYPEFCCLGNPANLGGSWRTHDVCCIGNEQLFPFLDDIFSELVGIFPSPWIHIGGDECPKDRWKACPKCQSHMKSEGLKNEEELQSYFVRRMEKMLEGKGRKLLGWDEILEGGLAPNATVQSWRSMKSGLTSAGAGHDVVMSPTSHCYLDYAHKTTPVQKTYAFEPIPSGLGEEYQKHILGVEGCMWLGNVSMQHLLRTGEVLPVSGIDAQVFPRIIALAEVGWSPKDARDWLDFKARLIQNCVRLDNLGVRYTRDETVWPPKLTP